MPTHESNGNLLRTGTKDSNVMVACNEILKYFENLYFWKQLDRGADGDNGLAKLKATEIRAVNWIR